MAKYRRGDCVYILPKTRMNPDPACGYPAIILTDGDIYKNRRVNCVLVTRFPRDLCDTDVQVDVTGVPSVARCGVIQSMSLDTLGDFIGRCTDEELYDIERAVAHALGLHYGF